MSTIYLEGIGDALPIDDVAESVITLLVDKGLIPIDARPARRGGLFVELRNGDEADRAIALLDGALVERHRVRAAAATCRGGR